MDDIYIIGSHALPVANYSDTSFEELTRQAYLGALRDSGFQNGDALSVCHFSNYMADFHGQNMCRGNNFCIPLLNEGLMPAHLPILNHEVGCASGSVALNAAWMHILAGQGDVACAIGVEKMFRAKTSNAATLDHMGKAEPVEHYSDWRALLERIAAGLGEDFAFGADRSIAMDFYALLAQEHMKLHGLTVEQLAHVASKNHRNSLGNPRSQYHFDMSVGDVLVDRMVKAPLTRAMCAPIGDGAAAVILCSAHYLGQLPAEVQARALRIRASVIAGGVFQRQAPDDRAEAVAARRAYQMAGLGPKEIDVVELHDATAFAEIHVIEDLQLCPPGRGGAFTATGATARDGMIPVNPSGGLISRGHPIGATGLIMINELALQLRGEAGGCQVSSPRIALQENGGGLVGLDKAVCAIHILERVA